ncbi:MAG: hypothetical protein WA395_09025 [Nitrososphaeraceae archaeon]
MPVIFCVNDIIMDIKMHSMEYQKIENRIDSTRRWNLIVIRLSEKTEMKHVGRMVASEYE